MTNRAVEPRETLAALLLDYKYRNEPAARAIAVARSDEMHLADWLLACGVRVGALLRECDKCGGSITFEEVCFGCLEAREREKHVGALGAPEVGPEIRAAFDALDLARGELGKAVGRFVGRAVDGVSPREQGLPEAVTRALAPILEVIARQPTMEDEQTSDTLVGVPWGDLKTLVIALRSVSPQSEPSAPPQFPDSFTCPARIAGNARRCPYPSVCWKEHCCVDERDGADPGSEPS